MVRHSPLSLPAVVEGRPGFRLRVEASAAIGVVTEGKSGIQANSGKGFAKHFVDAGVMTGWYSAPHSLAANGWRCRTKGPACEGAEGRPTCPAAAARHRGRRAARALSATSRSRADGGGSLTATAPHRTECRAGRTESRACGTRRAVARGLARGGGGIRSRAPARGNAGGRRAEGLAGQVPWGTPRPPHATAREHASEGLHRNPLRNPNDLPGRERIAHHNLAG